MAGLLIVRVGEREWVWGCSNDVLLAAIDRAFRRRLTAGESVFISSDAVEATGRSWATIVIPPSAFVSFSYTEHDGDDFGPLTREVQELVDRDGGVTIDADDQLVT